MTAKLSRWVLLATMLLMAGVAMGATVTATLEPTQVAVGEEADLTVTVSGPNAGDPSLSAIDGLDITSSGTSQQVQIANGAISSNTTYSYTIVPRREGTFTIPAIKAGDAQSQPLTLRVLKSGAPAGGTSGAAPTGTEAQFGFTQIVLPKSELYVGEVIPVEIRACVAGGVQAQLTALPTLTSEALTLNALGKKPHQAEEIIEGKRYTVVSWHSAITAVKAGDYPVTLQMPLLVVVPENDARRGRADPFDNFFNRTFFRARQKEVSLTNGAQTVKILPLPTENRPANYSGAIGHFEIAVTAKPETVPVGDPVTLHLTISGKGNFDRVTSDMATAGSDWKTYAAKGAFEPSDANGCEGTKTFEQIAIPTTPGARAIPPITFSYFDPEKKQYAMLTAAPVTIQVTGSVAAAVAPVLSAPASSSTTGPAPAVSANPLDALTPNKIETGAFVSTLRPLYLQPWFIVTQTLPLLLLIAGVGYLRRHHRLSNDPRLIRATAANRAIQTQLAAMDSAMQNQESEAFFTAARRALQQRLGDQWDLPPDSVTLEEIRSRMDGEAETLRPLFEMADHISYSGQAFNEADFLHWRDFVTTQLKRLDR